MVLVVIKMVFLENAYVSPTFHGLLIKMVWAGDADLFSELGFYWAAAKKQKEKGKGLHEWALGRVSAQMEKQQERNKKEENAHCHHYPERQLKKKKKKSDSTFYCMVCIPTP